MCGRRRYRTARRQKEKDKGAEQESETVWQFNSPLMDDDDYAGNQAAPHYRWSF